jgi:hypothetical protein
MNKKKPVVKDHTRNIPAMFAVQYSNGFEISDKNDFKSLDI